LNVIVVLLLASLSVAVTFLAAFIWAVRSGQYEDTTTPSMRMLTDDEGEGAAGEEVEDKSKERGTHPA